MEVNIPLVYSVLFPTAAYSSIGYVSVHQDEMLELECYRSSFIDELAAEVKLDP